MKYRSVPPSEVKDLRIASAPFIYQSKKTRTIMFQVALACIPGIAAEVKFFGYGTLIQSSLAIIFALLSEAIVLAIRKFPIRRRIADNSALLTALLLGISIPPLAPWWMIVIGTFWAIVVAKQTYGGLGQNPFNPAMIGYVVLLISFPVQMTSWPAPQELHASVPSFQDSWLLIFNEYRITQKVDIHLFKTGYLDSVSQATPLDALKTGLRTGCNAEYLLKQVPFGGFLSGIGWQWVNIGFLAGGLLMLAFRLIRWQIPASMLVTLTICSIVSWECDPARQASPLVHLFSGGSMLGAFFIATDPVTASTTPKGQLIYGGLIGVLSWVIRVYGGYPDGVAFAVLLANSTVPLIDYYTQPRAYGHR